MRKLIICLLIVIASQQTGLAQIAYYDAIELSGYVKNNKFDPAKKDRIDTILACYLGKFQTVSSSFGKNPFIADYLADVKEHSRIAGVIGNIPSNISGIDVTNIANSVSQIMIERAKQELTIAFFGRFKKFIEEHKEAKVLFPKTADNISNLLSYQYPEMLPTLRTGFLEDLRNLPNDLDYLLELDRYKEVLKDIPDIRVVVRSLRLLHQMESGYLNPDEVLYQLSAMTEWKDKNATTELKNIGSTLDITSLISQSLRNDPARSANNTRTWVTLSDLKLLTGNATAFRIYLGLIYQGADTKKIKFYLPSGTLAFTDFMSARKDDIIFFQTIITGFAELAAKADKVTSDLKYKQDNHIALSKDDYYNYINASIDVIEFAFTLARPFDGQVDISKYTKIARKSNDLYRHIYKEEYPQALINAVDIINEITELIDKADKKALTDAIHNAPGGKDIAIPDIKKMGKKKIAEIEKIIKKTNDTAVLKPLLAKLTGYYYADQMHRWTNDLRRYGLFMSNIVIARSSKDMQLAIESAILPVGSSSIKKNSAYNISIQSYLGAYGRVGSPPSGTNTGWSDPFGVTAPIGITLSHGLKKAGSISLFVSLFDLGAIVDYKLKTDTVTNSAGAKSVVAQKEYKIQLGQVFSPGVHLVYGFPYNLPLSLGIGGQYGPGLSKIDNTGTTVINNPYWRWNILFAVDLPFFTVYNKTRNTE